MAEWRRTNWVALLLGLVAAGGLGTAAYLEFGRGRTSKSATVTVAWGGISGTVTAADGVGLPSLTTTITNPDTAAHTYTLQASAGPIAWETTAASFSLAPGESRAVSWNATYQAADGAGPFDTTLAVEVDAMPTQSFTDPTTFQISVTPSAPAASIEWVTTPSGTQTVAQGSNLDMNVIGDATALQIRLTNTGTATGSFTVTAAITGPTNGAWFAFEDTIGAGTNQTISTPVQAPVFQLDPGEAVLISWGTAFNDAQPSYDGTYTTTVTVSW